jgi:hypothetical protein
MKEEQPRHSKPGGWFILLPILAVLALLAFGIGSASTKTSLYFFDKSGRSLVTERRVIPLVGSVEARAMAVLEELLLGPVDHNHIAPMPPGTRLVALLHRGNRLEVSLATEALYSFKLDFPKVREAFEKTLASSVPGYGILDLYINGQLTTK